SMSVRKALPAEAAMKPISPPIMSISSAPRDRFPALAAATNAARAGRARPHSTLQLGSRYPSEGVHSAASRLHLTVAPHPSSLAATSLHGRPLSCFRAHVSRRSDDGKAARLEASLFAVSTSSAVRTIEHSRGRLALSRSVFPVGSST